MPMVSQRGNPKTCPTIEHCLSHYITEEPEQWLWAGLESPSLQPTQQQSSGYGPACLLNTDFDLIWERRPASDPAKVENSLTSRPTRDPKATYLRAEIVSSCTLLWVIAGGPTQIGSPACTPPNFTACLWPGRITHQRVSPCLTGNWAIRKGAQL